MKKEAGTIIYSPRELHSFVIQRQSGSDHSCFVIFHVYPPPCLLASPLICNQGEYPRQGAKARCVKLPDSDLKRSETVEILEWVALLWILALAKARGRRA